MADRQPALGVSLREPLPWGDQLELVRTAEDAGYDAVCTPEVGVRDPLPMLAGFAAATSRIRLITGVLSMEHRAPVAAATGAATVHELSGGRHVLGLGAGYRRLAEFLDYAGEVRSALAAHPLGPAPPIWFAALGDRAVEAAGRHADGVILNWCTPERVAEAARTIRAARGDGMGSFTVAVYVRCCLTGVDHAAPLEALRRQTAVYASMPHYRRQFETMGFGDEAAAAAKALEQDHLDLVPESLVDALCVRGGRKDVLARVDAYARAGADLVVVYPVPAREPVSSMLGTILAAAPSPAVEH